MVARSFAHSSPGWDPTGVIFTFWARAADAASRSAIAAQAVFMSFLQVSLRVILARRLLEEGPERRLVDLGALQQPDVPHELARAPQEPLRVFQAGAAEKSELGVVRGRIDIGDRNLPLQPAAVAPFDRFLELRRRA